MLLCNPYIQYTYTHTVMYAIYLPLPIVLALRSKCEGFQLYIFRQKGSLTSYTDREIFSQLHKMLEVYSLLILTLISNIKVCLKFNLVVMLPTDFYIFIQQPQQDLSAAVTALFVLNIALI